MFYVSLVCLAYILMQPELFPITSFGSIICILIVFFKCTEILEGYKAVTHPSEEDKKSQRSLHAQLEAVADIKFTYVATCQNYGNQKRSGDRRATDILNLLVKYVGVKL